MRVVRINHKRSLVLFIVVVLAILFILLSKHSSPERHGFSVLDEGDVDVNIHSFATKAVDFIKIAKSRDLVMTKKKNSKPYVLAKTFKSKSTYVDQLQNGDLKKTLDYGKRKAKIGSNHLSYVIGIVVISCNRPLAIQRSLNGMLKYRPSSKQFPIVVSQDCGDVKTAQAISKFGNTVRHIRQPDLSEPDVPANMKQFAGYYKIARHFKWALTQMFEKMGYNTVLIVEDDLDIAPDFFDYFLATRHLLDEDPTIWCVSAWNDNGKSELIEPNKNGKLYRSDFFPGLGWMITKKLWNELGPKWPSGFWDDWMRESAQRKNRVCIRPEISRTKTFGRIGVSQGQFYDQHLKFIVLNDRKFDFLNSDLSYLLQESYDRKFLKEVEALPVFSIEDIIAERTKSFKAVKVVYLSESHFNRIGSMLGIMLDFKAGVPRAAYQGIVTVMHKGIRIYVAPNN